MRVRHAVISNRRGTVTAQVGDNYIVEWDGEGSEFLPISMVVPER